MNTTTKSTEIDQILAEKHALHKTKLLSLIAGKRSFPDYFPQVIAISLAFGVSVYFGARGDISPAVVISIWSVTVAIIIYVGIESRLLTRQIMELKELLEKTN